MLCIRPGITRCAQCIIYKMYAIIDRFRIIGYNRIEHEQTVNGRACANEDHDQNDAL